MSFFGGSARKKKFQSDDDEAAEYLEASEEESRESWGTSKKTRKGSYFSNFESENESVEVNTDKESYVSNDQFNRRKEPQIQSDGRNDESYSKSMGRYSTEAYESTDSEFEMAREATLQVDKSMVPVQTRQTTFSDTSRNPLNRSVRVASNNRNSYENIKLINELEDISAPAQFDNDHSSKFQASRNKEVEVSNNNTPSPTTTNVLQDSSELINRNRSSDVSKSSLQSRQQLDSSAHFSHQDLNQTKTAPSTPAAALRSPINPIKATNSKYLQPFAKSSTCMLKPAVLFTRESCKRPFSSLSRPTGGSSPTDPSQRPLVRAAQDDPSSLRSATAPTPTATKFPSRQEGSTHSHRDDERQQSSSPSNISSSRTSKEITPEKQSADSQYYQQQQQQQQQQYLMSPNENPTTRSSLPRQCENPDPRNDRTSSPDMSALITPRQSQLVHREQYSDAKRSRSECVDNYSKDSDSSPPVSQERRLSGFSGGSAVSEAIYSSSPTSTTTPGSTNGNLGYSSATSSGSRIEVTPPGDRGWAAQRAAMEEEEAAGSGSGSSGGGDDDDVDVVQGCQDLEKKIQSLRDEMDGGRTLIQQEILLHSITGEQIAIATCK